MLKQYKKHIIISSLATLSPIIIGLLLWNQLPDTIATHWGVDNQADGYTGKAFAVFGIPLMILLIHWLGLWVTSKDPKQKNQSVKAFSMIFWIIPMISLFCCSMIYATALGYTPNLNTLLFLMMGALFMGMGNYMPKTKQNHTLGIKISWTLSNEENWNATHRLAGKLWFFGGFAIILCCFLPQKYGFFLLFPITLVMVAVPVIYSWAYYKKQCREGSEYPLWHKNLSKSEKLAYRLLWVFLVLLFAILGFIMFTGSITVDYQEETFTVDASFSSPVTIRYDSIDTVELRQEAIDGTRQMGFASARLLLGTFQNEEFGLYTRYTYTNCSCAIVLTSGENTLVLAAKTPEETEVLYQELLARIG